LLILVYITFAFFRFFRGKINEKTNRDTKEHIKKHIKNSSAMDLFQKKIQPSQTIFCLFNKHL